MADLLHDLRFTLRGLARAPGFAILAVLTLAIGVGANSAIFSVINGVVLRPLSYPSPDRLMFITTQFPNLGFDKFWVSPPEYFEYRERSRSYTDVAAYTTGAANLGEGDRPERVNTVFISANMPKVLGVGAMRGRTFLEAEDLPNSDPVVLLSYELWQRVFHGDPSVLNHRIDISGLKRTVVGIMPPGFDLHDAKAQLWLPLGLNPANRQNRGSHSLYLVGRLAPNVTPAQARNELGGLLHKWGDIPTQHVPNDSTHKMQMIGLQEEIIGNARTALWVLQAAVGFVLLIACANMANLLLARAETRHKEFAIRTALGAGIGRLLRQFMVEGVLLALVGAMVGLLLAFWAIRVLLLANPGSIPRSANVALDMPVLVFTIGIALLTGMLFGLAPLLHVRQQSVSLALKDGGQRTTATASRNRVRSGLVIAEVALAVMLVIGAGLMMKSFWNLMRVDAGFNRDQLVTFGLVLPGATYPDGQQRTQFFRDLETHLREIPGVQHTASMTGLPPFRRVNANDTEFEGLARTPGSPPQNVDYYQFATSDYLQTMGIPVKDGRAFNATDAGGAPVAMVNETLARIFYPNTSPLGRRLRPPFGDSTPWLTIVGIVKDVKQGGLDSKTGSELYLNFEQSPRDFKFAPNQMNVVVRSRLPLETLAPRIRGAVGAMDKSLPIVQLRTMNEVFAESVSRQRFLAQVLGAFATVALALAAIGTYGILSYTVTERGREIGIRVALGASRERILAMIVRQGMTMAVAGVVIGIAGALALTRYASTLFFGVAPTDPATFAIVSAFIAAVAIAACVIPARRATRVDPMVALREE